MTHSANQPGDPRYARPHAAQAYPTMPGYPNASVYPNAPGYPAAPVHPSIPIQPPAITTTLLITLFFGLFGLIPASMHSSRARELGQPTNKYWKTFGWTFGIEVALVVLLYVVIIAAIAGAISSS